MAGALRSFLPGWEWAAPSGGLTVWARLPSGVESTGFAQAALRHGVAVVPGRLLSGGGGRHVRLAFTQPPERLVAAVRALAGV